MNSFAFSDVVAFQAESLEGPWSMPFMVSPPYTRTFSTQSGFSLRIKGTKKTSYLYMGDTASLSSPSVPPCPRLPTPFFSQLQILGIFTRLTYYCLLLRVVGHEFALREPQHVAAHGD